MELRQRKVQNLQPGAPDVPKSRRSSAEVRADKKRKEAVKEAAALKSKIARARVEEVREATRLEQVENDSREQPVKGSNKMGATRSRGKKAAMTNVGGSKPKGKVNSKKAKSSINVSEPTTDDSVSAEQTGANARVLTNPTSRTSRASLPHLEGGGARR